MTNQVYLLNCKRQSLRHVNDTVEPSRNKRIRCSPFPPWFNLGTWGVLISYRGMGGGQGISGSSCKMSSWVAEKTKS